MNTMKTTSRLLYEKIKNATVCHQSACSVGNYISFLNFCSLLHVSEYACTIIVNMICRQYSNEKIFETKSSEFLWNILKLIMFPFKAG